MNLSNEKLKLFKVNTDELGRVDAFGVHIGNESSTDHSNIEECGMIFSYELIGKLYVSGHSILQVSDYLCNEGIQVKSIKEVDTLLDSRGGQAGVKPYEKKNIP